MHKLLYAFTIAGALPVLASAPAAAAGADADSSAKTPKFAVADADLGPADTLSYTVDEGTWMCLDVSPDGKWIVFDLLGDIFRMPMAGGHAELLRGGRPYEAQPRYSPDGARIAFTSDAGGGDNIWVMRADGSDARAVTKEDFRLLNNPAWTPDGKAVVARKHFTSGRSLGSGEMWLYDVTSGGGGVQITKRPNDQKDVNEPEISPDGRYLFYSIDSTPGSVFQYNKDPNDAIYTIRRVDLVTGEEITVCDGAGGSVRPEISPDGSTLAFVRRAREHSVLMLRDLASGVERPLYEDLSRDNQETWATFGAYPGYAWTPDGRAIVIWAQGKIQRIDAATGRAQVIPFTADLTVAVTEAVRFRQEIGGPEFPVRVIHWPRVSPDGKRVVFQALGVLWIRDLNASGAPRRLTKAENVFEFHPRWAPDGSRIVYTTWSDVDAGRVMSVRADGSSPRELVTRPGHYGYPTVAPDGAWVVYARLGGDRYRGSENTTDTGIYVVPAAGGDSRLVTEHGADPRFDATGKRILLFEEAGDKKTLYSVDLLGGDRRDLVTSERAMELVPSPDGRWIGFEELWEVYVAPTPEAGGPIAVGPKMKNLPVRKVSTVAGEFLDWSPQGDVLRFGLGPDLYSVSVPALFAPGGDTLKVEPDSVRLGWTAKADVPDTDVLFTGCRILTMADPPVIENGAVHVQGNRITAVGPASSVSAPGAHVIDVSGKTLMPGLVDIHSHMGSSNYDMHSQANWSYRANLSFGVTCTHDPSNDTRMVFASSELVKAGIVLGPRVFSTGTVLYGAEGDFKAVVDDLDDARRHLKRIRAYGGFSVKSYNQPRREQRMWIIKAARELGMEVVPEGGSFYTHNMTMFMDGHTTLEHSIPVSVIYDDALTLVSRSHTGYTPTLIVAYGGMFGENYWYQHDNVWENERLLTWVPRSIVDSRSRRRTMAPEEEYNHIRISTMAAEVARRGGLVELGAHGQLQGLGAHWELWMFGQGGMEPYECLRTATLNGAKALGLDTDLGSIEAGKLADLIVLDANPLDDLRNSEQVALTMINGRLYDAHTLDEIAPEAKPLPRGPRLDSIPVDDLGMGCLEGVNRP